MCIRDSKAGKRNKNADVLSRIKIQNLITIGYFRICLLYTSHCYYYKNLEYRWKKYISLERDYVEKSIQFKKTFVFFTFARTYQTTLVLLLISYSLVHPLVKMFVNYLYQSVLFI